MDNMDNMDWRIAPPIESTDECFILTCTAFGHDCQRELSITLDFTPRQFEELMMAMKTELEDYWRKQEKANENNKNPKA